MSRSKQVYSNMDQLDFFGEPVPPKLESTRIRKRSAKVNTKHSPRVIQKYREHKSFFESSFNKACIDYIKFSILNGHSHVILSGKNGSGKTYLAKNIGYLNSKIRSKYVSFFNWDELNNLVTKELNFTDIIIFDDLDNIKLDEEKIIRLTNILNYLDSIKVRTLFISKSALRIKKYLEHSIWGNTINLIINSLESFEKVNYLCYFNKLNNTNISNQDIESKALKAKNIKELHHFCINLSALSEQSRSEPKLKEISKICFGNFDHKHDLIEKDLKSICNDYIFNLDDIKSTSRKKEIIFVKHYVWYLLKIEYQYSFVKIANYFEKNHTTIMHAVKKVEESLSQYKKIHNIN